MALRAQVVAARAAIFAQVTAWLDAPARRPPPDDDNGCGWHTAGMGVNIAMAALNVAAAIIMGVMACRRYCCCGGGSSAGGSENGGGGYVEEAEETHADGDDGDAQHADGLHAPLLGSAA
jgi:hypothetical protein